jgi:hypothetical protein
MAKAISSGPRNRRPADYRSNVDVAYRGASRRLTTELRQSDAARLHLEPALVYHSDRRARVVVCLPARPEVSARGLLAYDRRRCCLSKSFSGASAGFLWYFIYLTCASFIPSVGFFKTAQSFINWRAFSFTFFLLLMISLLWEVTLALPYAWWRYRDEAISRRGDDRSEDRCVVRITHRSALRLDGGELHNRDRLRGNQNLESARQARPLGLFWNRRHQSWLTARERRCRWIFLRWKPNLFCFAPAPAIVCSDDHSRAHRF